MRVLEKAVRLYAPYLIGLGAVRLIQYVVYYAAMDTSCGTLDVELSNK